MKELPIIIKADVQGSAEVLADTLTKLSDEKVKIRIIHAGVGAVNESDVLLASASNAIIIALQRAARSQRRPRWRSSRRRPPAVPASTTSFTVPPSAFLMALRSARRARATA